MADEEELWSDRVGEITYHKFFTEYLLQNKLCVFSSELTREWRSRKEWMSDGKPNFDFLGETFGSAVAPVADCNNKCYDSHGKEDMNVEEFICYWKSKAVGKDGDQCSSTTRSLYLKDWHFCKQFPEYKAYETPLYFKCDWLNEFWDQRQDVSDDYRFVYMGPKGTWTPFHADVFRSYSWSANICGCKKWILFPPGEEKCFYDSLGNLAYDVTDLKVKDEGIYPKAKAARNPIIVMQGEGETIFVPSGWYHQVHNMEDTISINHNWTNACGLFSMWNHIENELTKVKRSIADCQGMDGWYQHCQLLLKAVCGMDYKDFIEFLRVVASPRIQHVKSKQAGGCPSHPHVKAASMNLVFTDWAESLPKEKTDIPEGAFTYYCRYDLSQIFQCLREIKTNQDFIAIELDNRSLGLSVDALLKEITVLRL